MSEVISSLMIELGLETKDFENSLKDVNRATKQMETSFNGAKKALALSEKGIEDYTKAISSGEDVIKQYQSKLDSLNDVYKEQQEKLKKYKKEFDELPAKIADVEKNLKELERTVGTNSKEYQKAEKELQKYQQKLEGMDRTLSNAVSGLRSFENQIAQTENKMVQASKEVNNLREELSGLNDVNTSGLKSMFEGVDISNFTGQIEGLDGGLDLLALGAGGAGLALAGMITSSVINGAKEYDRIITDLEINLGATEQQAENLNSKIMSFSDGGYNIQDVADAVTSLSQTMNISDEETEKLSQTMDILNDKGFDINEMVRFVQSGYQNWGTTGEETLGILIRGMQNGVNISGDLLDTFLEYAPIFAQNGVKGEEMLALIEGGMKSTGMTADNTADIIKEFFLKFSEGGDTVEGTFNELGLDLGTLQSQVDSGHITMSDAFKTVAGAITDVEDKTDQARIMAELFGGTTEYTNAQAFESWSNLETKTYDVASAVDEVTTAYEGSYQASQQDFSNSWNELTQTIGSIVLPILTEIINSFNRVITVSQLSASNFGIQMQVWSNQLKSFFLEVGISILENLAQLPFAEKILPNLNYTLESMKTNHSNTIDYIQGKEQEMKNNSALINAEYQTDKEQTFENVKNTAEQKTKEMSNAVDANTKDAGNKAKANMDAMKTDVENSLSGLGNIALTSTGEIPKATKHNLDVSELVIKQFATDAYTGVRQSFQQLEKSVKTSLDNVNKHITSNFSKATSDANKNVEDLYNSTRTKFINIANIAKNQMASFARECSKYSDLARRDVMLDWSTMKSYIQSNPIKGSVTITKTTRYATVGSPETQTLMEGVDKISTLNRSVSGIDFYSSRYKATPIVSKTTKNVERMNDSLLKETQQQNKLLTELLGAIMAERTTVVENTIQIDGKAIARGTARYMENEITNLNYRKNRLGGALR